MTESLLKLWLAICKIHLKTLQQQKSYLIGLGISTVVRVAIIRKVIRLLG
ncbi:MAG: hypothetical protein K5895_00465 [Lachnospiraceae bacterium]|nr:hypothetical protein [Lachnospiraceae bacterium]